MRIALVYLRCLACPTEGWCRIPLDLLDRAFLCHGCGAVTLILVGGYPICPIPSESILALEYSDQFPKGVRCSI